MERRWHPFQTGIAYQHRRRTMATQARKVGKVAALIAGGALVGAGLGLLYAPQAGAQTRRMIREQAKKAQVEASRIARRVKVGVERVKSAVGKQVPQLKAA